MTAARRLTLALLAVLLLALTAFAFRETPQQRADRARLAQAAPFCLGRTARGERCLRRTRSITGFCWQHEPAKAIRRTDVL